MVRCDWSSDVCSSDLYEMMLSESQERMLICVKSGEEEKIQELFQKYDLDAVTIGKIGRASCRERV